MHVARVPPELPISCIAGGCSRGLLLPGAVLGVCGARARGFVQCGVLWGPGKRRKRAWLESFVLTVLTQRRRRLPRPNLAYPGQIFVMNCLDWGFFGFYLVLFGFSPYKKGQKGNLSSGTE